MDVYFNQIVEIIELVGKNEINYDKIEPLTLKSQTYLFEYVINERY